MPFKHHAEDDVDLLKSEQQKILAQISLVDIFKDFSGLELDLTSRDFVPEAQFKKNVEKDEAPHEIE